MPKAHPMNPAKLQSKLDKIEAKILRLEYEKETLEGELIKSQCGPKPITYDVVWLETTFTINLGRKKAAKMRAAKRRTIKPIPIVGCPDYGVYFKMKNGSIVGQEHFIVQ